MKTIMIAVIALVLAIAPFASAEMMPEDVHCLEAVVFGWERTEDPAVRIIECLAEDGDIWTFYDDEGDWAIGDVLYLVIWEGPVEPEIVDLIWFDFLEPVEMSIYMSDIIR